MVAMKWLLDEGMDIISRLAKFSDLNILATLFGIRARRVKANYMWFACFDRVATASLKTGIESH